MNSDKELKDLVAAGISLAIDDFLRDSIWILDDVAEGTWLCMDMDKNVVINEVTTRMAELSTHLRANFCEDILRDWEISNDDKNSTADNGQGNPGKSGERHDPDTTPSRIVEEIAKGIRELKET
jgi:hypothetical protein